MRFNEITCNSKYTDTEFSLNTIIQLKRLYWALYFPQKHEVANDKTIKTNVRNEQREQFLFITKGSKKKYMFQLTENM